MTVANRFSQPLRNRLIILLIVLICVVPFAIAWYLAQHPEWVEKRQKSNYGHLISPAIPLDYATLLANPLSAEAHLPEIKGHWVMVQVAAGPVCAAVCRETAFKTGKLRLMLNKEISRTRRLLLVPGAADRAAFQELFTNDPTLLVAGASPALMETLHAAIGRPVEEGMLLLLDPFANLLMWYEAGFDPYGALRDLQRLLRISQIG